MAVIDLCAFEPEPLEIKLKSGAVYIIPASISVQLMTKIINLQNKASQVKNPIETFNVLNNLAFEILSLDKSKDVTMDMVQSEFNDLVLLRKFVGIFDNFMTESIENVIPEASTPKQSVPNKKTSLKLKK